MRSIAAAVILVLVVSAAATGATFVVPSDATLISKSRAIVLGDVISTFPRFDARGEIETVSEISVAESMKGRLSGIVRVHEMGGFIEGQASVVVGAPRFNPGDRVLVFLTQNADGNWTTQDMVVGKFTSVAGFGGRRVLLREADEVSGWDVSGKAHRERARGESEFLSFVRLKAQGMNATENYFVDDRNLAFATQSLRVGSNAAPFAARTYATLFTDGGGNTFPGRWPIFATAGTLVFQKIAAQNLSGAPGNGGDSITAAAAAWTGDCGSLAIVARGADTSATAAGTAADAVNSVTFNDIQNEIAGSWTGSGTIAFARSRAVPTFPFFHTFSSEDWVSIGETDIVFQDGYPGNSAVLNMVMTHEMGHSLGFRHSDFNGLNSTCDAGSQECSNSSIMKASVATNHGTSLQPWDLNAVQSIYPSTCSGAVRSDFNADGKSDVSLKNSVTGSVATWQMNGLVIAAGAEIANPGTAWNVMSNADFNGDTRADILLQNSSTGEVAVWLLNGSTITSSAIVGNPGIAWVVKRTGDFNADGKSDIVLQNSSTGMVATWQMNGITLAAGSVVGDPGASWFVVATGDSNADGKSDIFLRNSSTGQVARWQMNGGVLAAGAIVADPGTSWVVRTSGDFNADGRADLALQNTSTGSVATWLLNAAVISSGAEIANPGTSWLLRGSADYNGDGKSDLLLRNSSTGEVASWLLNGSAISASGIVGAPGTVWTPIAD